MRHKVNLYWDKWNYGVEERAGNLPATPSQFLEYVNNPTDVGIFVDYDGSLDNTETIIRNSQHKYKVMVLMEPASFNRALHGWVIQNEHLFDLIFVHYPAWKGSGKYPEKYRFYPSIGKTLIPQNERLIHPKSKNVAAIFSNKNFGLEGHIKRQEIREYINSTTKSIDFNNPNHKIDGLRDYRYEVVIENEYPYFISEKLIDSILSGCIPIIWGHPKTKHLEEFDKSGFIFFEDNTELYEILGSKTLTEGYYQSKMKAIKHNFEVVQKYLSFGDIIYNAGLKELF